MWPGFACFAETEIVNSARAAVYSGTHGISVRCTGGPWIAPSLGDPPYTSPDADDAPWYDPAEPDSKGFLGVVGLQAGGAEDSTGTSAWTDLIGDGAYPGPLRRAAREVQFRVVLVAVDDAALSYGRGWLASALRGSACGTCGRDELAVYAAAPAPPPMVESCDLGSDLPDRQSASTPVDRRRRRDRAGDPAGRGDQLARHLYRCRLLEGPTVQSTTRLPGGVVAEVQFTIKAGIPYWHHEPVRVFELSATPPGDVYIWAEPNWKPGAIYDQCRQQHESQTCLTPPPDPRYPCPPNPLPPPVPTPPVDPCYFGGFYDVAFRQLARIPADLAPAWPEKTLIVRVETRSKPVRSVLMRWHPNPVNRPPRPENLDPCGVCGEMWLDYLPAWSTLTLDGRTRTAVVECTGNRVQEPTLYGRGGMPYDWPTLDCSTGMFLELACDGHYPPDTQAQMTVDVVAREDAI